MAPGVGGGFRVRTASKSRRIREQGSTRVHWPLPVPPSGGFLEEHQLSGISSFPQTLGKFSVRDTWNHVPGSLAWTEGLAVSSRELTCLCPSRSRTGLGVPPCPRDRVHNGRAACFN